MASSSTGEPRFPDDPAQRIIATNKSQLRPRRRPGGFGHRHRKGMKSPNSPRVYGSRRSQCVREPRQLGILHGIVGQDARIAGVGSQHSGVILGNARIPLQRSGQRRVGAMHRICQSPDSMHSPPCGGSRRPSSGPPLSRLSRPPPPAHTAPAIEIENERRVRVGGPEFEAGKEPGRPGRDPKGDGEDAAALTRRDQWARVRVPETMPPDLRRRGVNRSQRCFTVVFRRGDRVDLSCIRQSRCRCHLPCSWSLRRLPKPRLTAGFRV